jgi:hypothetical protein
MAEVIHRYVGKGGKLPPGPSKEELRRKAEKAEADRIFVEEKTRQVAVRRLETEMRVAERRGELIEKRLVERQAAYLLVALRQRILTIPQAYARRILGLTDAAQASKILKEMSIAVLNDIMNLPQQVTDPNWLETLEAQENGEKAGQSKPRKRKR